MSGPTTFYNMFVFYNMFGKPSPRRAARRQVFKRSAPPVVLGSVVLFANVFAHMFVLANMLVFAKVVQGILLRGSEKQVAKQNPRHSGNQSSNWLQHGCHNLKVYSPTVAP